MFLEIDHLSASTISSFIQDRHGWFQRKFKGRKFEGNLHTERGNALEKGLDHFCETTNMEESQKVAVDYYRETCAGRPGYDVNVLESIAQVLARIGHKFPVEKVVAKQQKISVELPGLNLPVIGYLDYELSDEIVDLKSTTKKPSKLSQSYAIQGSIYRYAKKKEVSFWYGIHTKTANDFRLYLTDEEYEFNLKYAIKAGQAVERIYELLRTPFDFNSPGDLKELFELMTFPDLSSMWSKEDFKKGCEVLGL